MLLLLLKFLCKKYLKIEDVYFFPSFCRSQYLSILPSLLS
ncbi:hypothetical protein NC651_017695 [Populus alba x Populus x berolinensis]|nr:hypothetical protein NC651_017695 [Populus alba x Populus x berolinensis]